MRDHVSLIFSDELDTGILELRDSLVRGVSNPGEQLLHFPHISVASIDDHDDQILVQTIERFAKDQVVFPLTLGVVSVFVGRSFVASPTPTVELLELHRNLQRTIDVDRHIPNFLKPGIWVPHVSLISKYVKEDFDFILNHLAENFKPISGHAIGLAVDHHEANGEYGEDVRKLLFREARNPDR